MPLKGTYVASSIAYVADQVAEYESSKGRRGTKMRGLSVVLLTTVGHQSGHLRKSPLMRVEHDGTHAVIASVGGSDDHPGWYHNLIAHPECQVQDGPVIATRFAREVHGGERQEWWDRAVAAFPDYATYETKTERVIPVVLLETAEAQT